MAAARRERANAKTALTSGDGFVRSVQLNCKTINEGICEIDTDITYNEIGQLVANDFMGDLWNCDSAIHFGAIAGSALPLGHDFTVKDSNQPVGKIQSQDVSATSEDVEHAVVTHRARK